MKYRPDIDGLRAVAVIFVVLFHAYPKSFPGGYIGVDVFFVISGFLIASVLFDSGKTSAFSLKGFYARRIRRIFPALFAVLSTTLGAGWMILQPADLKNLGKHVLGGASFVSNLVLWEESGYFDKSAELKPLLHLWSLGVEEQFYIFFPLLIVLIRRFRLNRTVSIACCLVASLILSIFLTSNDPTSAFYNPLSRVWEILIGVLLADLLTRSTSRTPSAHAGHVMSLAGTSLFLLGVSTFNQNTLFPGWRALFPTLGAALVISAGPTALINKLLLQRRVMIGIGLISYPLYLWHWPLLVLARIHNGGENSTLQRTVLVLAAFLLAFLTYFLLERKFRFTMPARAAVISLAATMSVVAIAGQIMYASDGFPQRYPLELRELTDFKPNFADDALLGDCWIDQFEKPDAFSETCMSPKSNRPHWLVWGDSHAARLTPGLRLVLERTSRVSQLTRSSCPPILDTEFAECRKSNEHSLSLISKDPPDFIVLFGRWETYLKNNELKSLSDKLRMTVDKLKKIGVKEIILVGPAPFWEGDLPTNLVDLLQNSINPVIPMFTRFRLTDIGPTSEKELKAISSELKDVQYISILDALCNKTGCMTTTNGQPSGLTTWDYGHLTTPGAEFVAAEILKKIN